MLWNIDFQKYILNEDFTGKLPDMNLPENPSIFNFENLFQTGMDEETFIEHYENYIATALYSLDSNNLSETFDITKLAQNELSAMEEVAKHYFSAIDKDNDGILSEEEIGYISSKDGDFSSISNEDLNIFTSEIFNDEIEGREKLTFSNLEKSFNLTSPNSHSVNYSSPDVSTPAASDNAEVINKQISEINDKFAPLLEQKKAVMSDNTEYVSLVSQSEKLSASIILSEGIIEGFESKLHDVRFDLSAAKSELANLQDAVIFEDYQSVIEEKRAALSSRISSLEAMESDIEEQLNQEKSNLNNILKPEKDAVEQRISQIESQNPNAEINNINEQINKLNIDKANLQNKLASIREQSLSDAEIYGKAQAYRNSELVANLLNPLLTDETKAKYDKYYFESHGYSYCDQFVKNGVDAFYTSVLKEMGLTEEDINKYSAYEMSVLKNAGIDSKYVAGSEYVRECVGTKTWGQEYQAVLNEAGINSNGAIDISDMSNDELKNLIRDGKLYPGMTFLTLKNGQYHVGFVESINKDLSLNTIEGNTFIKYDDGRSETGTVGSHRHKPEDMSLQGASDVIAKVYFWMKMSGYSDEDINKYIYQI